MPDARKDLRQFRKEWLGCERCPLGEHRASKDKKQVFGQGPGKSILFVGESPSEGGEETGKYFCDKAEVFFEQTLHKLGITDYYVTNLVLCRSCSPVLDEHNLPRMIKEWGQSTGRIMYQDEHPTKAMLAACHDRLMEEIYLVDPFYIVALGQAPAEALFGRSVPINKARGEPFHVLVPGAARRPVVTAKKDRWLRKEKGSGYVLPVVQNDVFYLVMPTFQPGYVLQQITDFSAGSRFAYFIQDLKTVAKALQKHRQALYDIAPTVDIDKLHVEQKEP